MEKILNDHKTSDEKAYFIRNVNKIENPTEFFELIGKTSSTIRCTADGIAINDKIDISPESYNSIGKSVFDQKLNQLIKCTDMANSVGEDFLPDVPEDRRDEFKRRLEEASKLPQDQQKSETKKIIDEFSTGSQEETRNKRQQQEFNKARDDKFNKNWKKAEKSFNDQFKEMIKTFDEGINSEHEDYNDLVDLSKKKIDGTITGPEQQKLDNIVKEGSKLRKEHFFESSKGDLNTEDAQAVAGFKDKIKTFTNGKYERLCYRIHVDEVKQKLINIAGVQSFEDLKNFDVNNTKVFANMKISDFDYLNRVMNEVGDTNRSNDLFKASIQIANDNNFIGNAKTPNDLAAIVECIQKEPVL